MPAARGALLISSLLCLSVTPIASPPAYQSSSIHPIVTYLSQLHFTTRGEGTTLYSFFVTQQCFEVASANTGRVDSI